MIQVILGGKATCEIPLRNLRYSFFADNKNENEEQVCTQVCVHGVCTEKKH